MENQIYRVSRRRVGTKIELTLQDNPKVKVTGTTAEEAEDELCDLICDKYGDGEPVFDYFDMKATPLIDTFWRFRANEGVTTLNLPELYAGGLCKRCGAGLGKRKIDAVRVLREKLRGDVAFTASGPLLVSVFSSKMTQALLRLGLKSRDFAPVLDARDSACFELIGEAARLDWVPVNKSRAFCGGAQKCSKCDARAFLFVDLFDKDVRCFLSADFLGKNLGEIFAVSSFEPEPILSTKSREAIREQKDLRGFVWGKVGLVQSVEIDLKLKYYPFPKVNV